MDLVLESVGGRSLEIALGKLVPNGRLIWFGQASRKAPSIDFFSLFDGHQSAVIQHFDYTHSDTPDGVHLATLVRIDDLRSRRIRGKAILQL